MTTEADRQLHELREAFEEATRETAELKQVVKALLIKAEKTQKVTQDKDITMQEELKQVTDVRDVVNLLES